MQDRRFGRFTLSLELLDTRPDIARLILRDVIVLEAKYTTTEDISYVGVHSDFALVPVGADIPTYTADVIGGLSPRVTWNQLLSSKPVPSVVEYSVEDTKLYSPPPKPDPSKTVENYKRELALQARIDPVTKAEREMKKTMARYHAGEIGYNEVLDAIEEHNKAIYSQAKRMLTQQVGDVHHGTEFKCEQPGENYSQFSEAERYGLRGGYVETRYREEGHLGAQSPGSEPKCNEAVGQPIKKEDREH